MKALICPLCSLPLQQNVQGLACVKGHQFDRAKEGYFNLLPVHHKNSREPGDAKQQLIARRAFLTAGYFLPLVDELNRLIDKDVASVLDIGCGEGYFTRALEKHCDKADIYSVDIAKAGVRLAAKNRLAGATYCVASSYLLPLADESIDLILRIYAPSKDEELVRVLKPGGKLIIVTPGEQHLMALRKKIYQTIRPHSKPRIPEGYSEVNQACVSFPLEIPAGDLSRALLAMTPFAWKLTPELAEKISNTGVRDEADFQINVYIKK